MNTAAEAEQWGRLKEWLADALERPPAERQAYIAQMTGPDTDLRRELSALVAAAEQSGSPLDEAPVGQVLHLLDEKATEAWIGRRLGPYRLVRLIGGGGMGRVFLAERADGQYEQQVAIKLMRDGLGLDGLEARFKAERQILASLDHPNLAKILDGGITDDGVPYFVMELVQGEPLDAYCVRRALPVVDRLRLFRSVCLVVHYAHGRGVVHRDLKPANILVTGDGTVKLVDFGIAKRLVPDASAEPATATVQQAMTLEYASPEQVRGETATPASDVFSLGVVLYRLLAGAGPYPPAATGNRYELTRAICEQEAAPPSRAAASRALRRQLGGDLDAVVLMALRKDPARRYASADLLADDLFRHLEGLPVQARRGAWSYRAGRFMVRHRGAALGVLVANLALVLGLGLAAYEGVRANAERERAQRHFDSVRKLANVFMFDVYKEVERVPGSMDARTMLVDTALTYLKQLNAESHGDASLQLEIAEGYANIGDIQGGSSVANRGDSKAALASFDQALALVRPLMDKPGPWQEQARGQFVTTTARKGTVLMSGGGWKEAEAIELEGLKVAREQAAAAPADRAAARRLVTQMAALVQMYLRSANVAAFNGLHGEYLRRAQQLQEGDPNDPDLAADLGSAYTMRAVNLMQNVKSPDARREALGEYRKALDVLEPAYRKNPLHSKLAGLYGRAEGYLGHLHVLLGEPKPGLEHLRRAVEVSEATAAQDPKDARNRKELADAHGRLGQALFEMRDADGAAEEGRKALAAFAALPESAQNEVTVQFNRVVTHHMLGLALDARAAPAATRWLAPPKPAAAEACEQYRVAKALLEENAKRRPNSPLTLGMMDGLNRSLGRCPAPAKEAAAKEAASKGTAAGAS